MNCVFALPVLAGLLLSPVCEPVRGLAQQTEPTLHHRTEDADQTSSAVSSGISLLPQDVAGEYALNENDSIEITLDGGHLGGYLSKSDSSDGDENIPLTFFFSSVTVRGRQFSFATEQLHGVSYMFEGTIVRGAAKARPDRGYYLLTGTLIERGGSTDKQRNVSLKSVPTCVEESCE